jgi:hypothetical protein
LAPGIPGNVERAGFVDFLVRNVGLSERPKLAPEAGSVPASVESREIVRDGGLVAPHHDPCRHHGRLSVFWGTHNSLRQNRLSAITLLGEEPKIPVWSENWICLNSPWLVTAGLRLAIMGGVANGGGRIG